MDASSYAPVQLNTTGTDGGTSLRFTTYDVLPANDANEALLSLADQHPSATVDRSQFDYLVAEKRLFETVLGGNGMDFGKRRSFGTTP